MNQAYFTLAITVAGMVIYGAALIRKHRTVRAEELLTFAMWCGAVVTGPYMVVAAFSLSKQSSQQTNALYVGIFGVYLLVLSAQKLPNLANGAHLRGCRPRRTAITPCSIWIGLASVEGSKQTSCIVRSALAYVKQLLNSLRLINLDLVDLSPPLSLLPDRSDSRTGVRHPAQAPTFHGGYKTRAVRAREPTLWRAAGRFGEEAMMYATALAMERIVRVGAVHSPSGRSVDATPLWIQVIISFVVLGASLLVILAKRYSPKDKHWAYAAAGTILGYWLR